MWYTGQYLWNSKTRKPVKYLGIELSTPTKPAIFHYQDSYGKKKSFKFNHHSEWSHFKEMYSKDDKILF